MATIVIRELGKTETGFKATLVIAGDSYEITVSDPFAPRQEQELEWYFENWLRYPMLDNVMADRAKTSIREYGEDLFKQVFKSNPDAYVSYREISQDLSQVTIEIESISPEFQAIHWEALQDKESAHPLAVETIVIRKSTKSKKVKIRVKESPTINLLVVTARPGADRDIPHRIISRPLVDVIRKAKLRVNIEILRPGTYEALAKHLETKGNGYYHIVHFDLHGGLKFYDDYLAGFKQPKNPYLYPRYGREDIKPYKGKKAFLAFEGNQIGQADPVEASEIADLLTSEDIPVCILNACQSGKQLNPTEAEDNRETSLGSYLMEAGMQLVVAMGYSVTVSAAEIMMQQLYESLFDEQDINQAIASSRKQLYERKARKAFFNTEIDLEDWLLPVVYSNGKVTFNLREFTPEEAEAYQINLDSKYKFTEPTYGFVGRDIDILWIEKALLNHNILLVQGMGGVGKSILLSYLREWWQATNFVQDSFYFGYDIRAYTLQQIIFEISKQLYNQFDFERFQAKNLSEQCQIISQQLRTNPYALILDNLESVTGQALAIQNTLDEPAREEIRKFLASLVGGKTKIILGSRIAEEWLQAFTFKENSYQLRGLDSQARTDLAESILCEVNSKQSLAEIKTDDSFGRLMKLLAGYPLAMEVVLANLKNQTTKEILEHPEKVEIEPEVYTRCIENSYRNLSKTSQELLTLIAPFQGFINNEFLYVYKEELGKLKPFKNYDLKSLEAAINEAIGWGLLSPIDSNYHQLLTIQPLLLYFLNNKLNFKDGEFIAYLTKTFKYYYQGRSQYYTDLMKSKDSRKKKWGISITSREYENIHKTLHICVGQKEEIYTVWYCLYTYLGLIQNKREQLELTENIYRLICRYNSASAYYNWEHDIIPVLGNLGRCYLEKRDFQQSRKIYENNLSLITQFGNIESSLRKSYLANCYHQLGAVNQELREYNRAGNYYDKFLEINDDRYAQAHTLHQLGLLAQKSRRYDQAREYYQEALAIYIEYEDSYSQARTYGQLGSVSLNLTNYDKAKEFYKEAIKIFQEYGEIYPQAISFFQLGRIALKLKDYDQAKDYYKKALDIDIKYGSNRYEQAGTYGQLGMLSEELTEWAEAKNYYLQALDIFAEFNDQSSLNLTIRNLARLHQKTQDQSLIIEVATRFETTEEEINELFTKLTTQAQ